jgi:hypothetical protein
VLASTIVFAEVAPDSGWPLYTLFIFLGAISAVLGITYRETLGRSALPSPT